MKTKTAWATPLIILATCLTACSRKEQAGPPPPTVVVATVTLRDVPIVKEAVATLDGFINANINAQVLNAKALLSRFRDPATNWVALAYEEPDRTVLASHGCVATPWNGTTIPRRCALPCTPITARFTPSNYRF